MIWTMHPKNVYWGFIDVDAPVREYKMHRLNFLFYSVIIIKTHNFYQMLIGALNDYKCPGAV